MPKLRHTTIEDVRRARTPCPRKECDGYVAEIVMPGHQYKQCNDCKHKYDFRNAKGGSVSEREWKGLREKAVKRAAGVQPAQGEDAQGSEGDKVMAKKTKKAKTAEKAKTAKKSKKPMAKRVGAKTGNRDSRIPKVGTVLKAKYNGKEYTTTVTADGFKFQDKDCGSISKVGSLIMGGKACNGYRLFGLC